MDAPPATIAPEIIACIYEGRLPTVGELRRVARRIRDELRGARSVFRWERSTEARERKLMLRAALAALAGSSLRRRAAVAA